MKIDVDDLPIGKSSDEVSGFVPTQHELLIIAKYWAMADAENRFDLWHHGGIGSREFWMLEHAPDRIDEIGGLVGSDLVEKVVEDAWEEFGKQQDGYVWWVFRHGSQEHREMIDRITASMMEEASGGDEEGGDGDGLASSGKPETGPVAPLDTPTHSDALDPGRRDPANDN